MTGRGFHPTNLCNQKVSTVKITKKGYHIIEICISKLLDVIVGQLEVDFL